MTGATVIRHSMQQLDNRREWSVPINVQVAKLLKFGDRPVSLFAGGRCWAESPEGGPEGIAFRTGLTFLFPK